MRGEGLVTNRMFPQSPHLSPADCGGRVDRSPAGATVTKRAIDTSNIRARHASWDPPEENTHQSVLLLPGVWAGWLDQETHGKGTWKGVSHKQLASSTRSRTWNPTGSPDAVQEPAPVSSQEKKKSLHLGMKGSWEPGSATERQSTVSTGLSASIHAR